MRERSTVCMMQGRRDSCRTEGATLLRVVASAWFLWLICVGQPSPGIDEDGQLRDIDSVVALLSFVIDVDEETAAKCLATIRQRVQSGEVRGQRLESLKSRLSEKIQPLLETGDSPLFLDAVLLATAWGDKQAVTLSLGIVQDRQQPEANRFAAVDAVAATADPRLVETAARLLPSPHISPQFSARLLSALSRYDSPRIASVVLSRYAQLGPEVQPKAVELLTQRTAWSKALLRAIGTGRIPQQALHANQIARLQASRDAELADLVKQKWGSVRLERNAQREEVLSQMRSFLQQAAGDAQQGQGVYHKVCGQCHRMHGVGQDVGPDITRNGRGSFEQLLSNVFDPSLVIGAAYQARTVITADGRVLTGLVTEDNPQRIVLKTQGGKLETIARADVDELLVSKLSLMPEGFENQLQPQELADLFAFLTLDKPPQQREATLIPGTPAGLHGSGDE